MLRTSKSGLFGLIGLSVAVLATVPAEAHWKKNHHHHGSKVVKVVKKVVYVPAYYRPHRRAHRHWDRHRSPRPYHRHHRRHHEYSHGYRTTGVLPSGHYGNKAITGGVIGAAVGALTGNTIGKGSGRIAAIVTGGVIGAIVGGHIGESMDKTDRLHASNALETVRTGRRVTWTNPDSGAEYAVAPTRTYRQENGCYCRDFTTWGWIDGKQEKLRGTACRMADGTWRQAG